MSEERFGFKIKWRCGRIKLERKIKYHFLKFILLVNLFSHLTYLSILACCKQIKMYSSYEEGGIYVKNGTVNGHDLFIGAEPENREFGLWYKVHICWQIKLKTELVFLYYQFLGGYIWTRLGPRKSSRFDWRMVWVWLGVNNPLKT